MADSRNTEIVCLGQTLVDCIIKVPGAVDKADFDERYIEADSIEFHPGGDAYNESVVLSRLGHSVTVICGIGEDAAGVILKDAFAKNNIEVAAVTNPGIQTMIACLVVGSDGKRKSFMTPLHGTRQYEIDTSLFQGKKLVSLASLFRAPLAEPEVVLAICRAAKAAGAIVSADTKIARGGSPTFEEMKKIMPYIDYFFPNEDEAAYYSGKDTPEEMADFFLECGVGHVLIKMGEKGCFVKDNEERFFYPAKKVEVVDTTGAGDNFVAGVLSGILRGRSLKEAVAFGTEVAAESIQYVGAT